MGLAAAGVISFAAVAQAEEKPTHQVLTAVSSTALSGYISTSVAWNPGKQVPTTLHSWGKKEGMNLDVIDIKLSSTLAEGEWASGYNVELWLGPDAADFGNVIGGTNGVIAIKNANVTLNIPVGNGIQAKLGIFDAIVGYESANSIENPNYSRSLAYSIEPTSHQGVLLSYKLLDNVSVNAGVANNYNAVLNNSAAASSGFTYIASASITAPDSLGFLKGAVLTAGLVDGKLSSAPTGVLEEFNVSTVPDLTLIYVGATLPTGIDGVNLGVAWDRVNAGGDHLGDALAGYVSIKLSDKATLNTRVEYVASAVSTVDFENLTTTLTLDYKLWANVVSRLEYRWQRDIAGFDATESGARENSHQLLAQIAYKF